MTHWYCPNCKNKKEPQQVTFEENCADCGTPVIAVDSYRGILFSKMQGNFYELTGEKPFFTVKKDDGQVIKVATPNYTTFLEHLLENK